MSTTASISFRESIRWLPSSAPSEPTQTIVLTSLKTGAFLDVRFNKHDGSLDWAFAGFRVSTPLDDDENSKESITKTKFTHYLDSRTLTPLTVLDIGLNTPLPNQDGLTLTLETGEMVNPATGVLTPYEEVWRDEDSADAVFIRTLNSDSDKASDCWRARVGRWQLALGRTGEGEGESGHEFWAWQAEAQTPQSQSQSQSTKSSNANSASNSNSLYPTEWTRVHSTPLPSIDSSATKFLPDESITSRWESGSTVEWEGQAWLVL